MRFYWLILIFIQVSSAWAKKYPACVGKTSEVIEYQCNTQKFDGLQKRLKRRLKSKEKIILMEFLRAKAIQRIEDQERELENTLKCFDHESLSHDCRDKLIQVGIDYKKMRIFLGLRKTKRSIEHYEDKTLDKVDPNISHFDFISSQKLVTLSDEEIQFGEEVFNEIKTENFLLNDVDEKEDFQDLFSILKYQDSIKEIKENNLKRFRELYLKVSLSNPVITFLSSVEPNLNEYKNAYIKLKEKLNNDKKLLTEKSYSDLKELFYFDAFINEILSENTNFCGIAEEVASNLNLSDTAEDSALSYGGSLLGIFSGPAGFLGLFLGNSYNTYLKIQDVKTVSQLSYLSGDRGLIDVDRKARSVGTAALGLPLNTLLGGFLSGNSVRKLMGVVSMISLDVASSSLSTLSQSEKMDKVGKQKTYIKKNYLDNDSRVRAIKDVLAECEQATECSEGVLDLQILLYQKVIMGDFEFKNKLKNCDNKSQSGKVCSVMISKDKKFLNKYANILFPSINKLDNQDSFYNASEEKKASFIQIEILRDNIRSDLMHFQRGNKKTSSLLKSMVSKVTKGTKSFKDLGSGYSVEAFMIDLDNVLFINQSNILK